MTWQALYTEETMGKLKPYLHRRRTKLRRQSCPGVLTSKAAPDQPPGAAIANIRANGHHWSPHEEGGDGGLDDGSNRAAQRGSSLL